MQQYIEFSNGYHIPKHMLITHRLFSPKIDDRTLDRKSISKHTKAIRKLDYDTVSEAAEKYGITADEIYDELEEMKRISSESVFRAVIDLMDGKIHPTTYGGADPVSAKIRSEMDKKRKAQGSYSYLENKAGLGKKQAYNVICRNMALTSKETVKFVIDYIGLEYVKYYFLTDGAYDYMKEFYKKSLT